MTTSKAYSAMMFVAALGIVSVLGAVAKAGDFSFGVCEDCNTNSACIGGLDSYACGDMSPLAMCPEGQWYFQADLIAFRRDAGQNEVFQTRNTNTLTATEVLDPTGAPFAPRVFTIDSSITRDPVLSTNDLDFQNAAGYRLLLGWRLAEKYAVEFSYFDLNDWNELGVVSDDTEYVVDGTADGVTGVITPNTQPYSLFSPFSGFGDPPIDEFDYNDLASIRYRSSLDNVELNLRHWITKHPSRIAVSVLWGGRHNAVREQFGYYSQSPIPLANTTNSANIRTANDLWGFQIGSQIDFCWDPGWHTEFEIKGGVAHNRALQESTYAIQTPGGGGGPGNLQNYWNRVDKDVTSWIGEMRLTLVYQFGPHLTTHIGYEALVLADVALASRNLQTDRSILASPAADQRWTINAGGSVVYHGPSAGFTFAW